MVVVFQSLNHVRFFVSPWTTACQASLSFTVFWNLLKLMSIELVRPPNDFILCWTHLLLPSVFPSIKSFPVSWLFASGGQSIGTSASVLPMNIQGWFPLGLTVQETLKNLLQHHLESFLCVFHSFLFLQSF